MIDAVRELEENIKRENLERTWQKIGKIMVWVSLVVILGTIVMVVMDQHHRDGAMADTNLFMRGVDSLVAQDYQSASTIFEDLTKDPEKDIYPLALLRLAQAQMGMGDKDATVRTFKALAASKSVFGGLGQMMLPPVKGDVPKPFKSSPFYHTLSEVRGWRLIGMEGARDNGIAQLLALYQDTNTPLSMHIRVTEALQELAPDLLFKAAEFMLNKEKQRLDAAAPQAETKAPAEEK